MRHETSAEASRAKVIRLRARAAELRELASREIYPGRRLQWLAMSTQLDKIAGRLEAVG